MAAPTDRVQVLKQESAAGGGDPADADPFLGYERINETEDAVSAAGVFLQIQGGTADEAAGLWREGDNIKAFDPAHPTPINLLDAAGTNVGADLDFLLENDPPEPNVDYAITRSAGQVTLEEWTRNGANLLKSIAYTRTGGVVDTIVTKVFDTDGTTVLAQTTETFTRSGGLVTGSAKTRDV